MDSEALSSPKNSSEVRDAVILSEVRFVCECLVETLNRQFWIGACRQVATLEQALALVGASRPGMVLLDVAFPGGPRTASRMCAAFPEANVIAFGVCETEENVLAWAEAGVAGYVPNTASVDDLVVLIDQINRGEQTCPSRITGGLLRHIAASRHEAALTSPALTLREREIFQLVGAGLCNKDIARRLGISLGTTKTHVHNLLGKLSLQRRADVMVRVRSTDFGADRR